MAHKTTRHRIIDRVKKAVEYHEKALECLKQCDEIADGRSEFIDKHLPGIVTLVNYNQELLDSYLKFL